MSEFMSAYADSDRDGEWLHKATLRVLESWGSPRDPESGELTYSEVAYARAFERALETSVRAGALERAMLELSGVLPPDDELVSQELLNERAGEILSEQGIDADAADEDDWVDALKTAITELGRPGQPRKDRNVSNAAVRDRVLDAAVARGAIPERERATWAERWGRDPKDTAALVVGLRPSETFAAFAVVDQDGTITVAPDDESSRLHEAAERLLALAGLTGPGGKNPYNEEQYMAVLGGFYALAPQWWDALEAGVEARGPATEEGLVLALKRETARVVLAVEEGAEPPTAAATPETVSGIDLDGLVELNELPAGLVRRARERLVVRGVTKPSDAEVVRAALELAEERLSA
jgi:hypothetical protein